MVGVLLTHSFDAKIINHKGKKNGADVVGPEAMGVSSRMVAIPSKVFDKSCIGGESCLRQAVHDLVDFNRD